MNKKTKQKTTGRTTPESRRSLERSALSKERQIEHGEESILRDEEKILTEEQTIERLEEDVERKEKDILAQEQIISKSESELLSKEEEILKGAERIYQKIHQKPMRKVTRMDINKGVIGAFFGLVSHFAFLTSGRVVDSITVPRALLILAMTYFIAYIMIERTGYRAIEEQRYLKYIPARVSVIYVTALLVSIFVLLLFDQIPAFEFAALIKTMAVTSLLAIPGAAGAHMLGHH